MSAESYDRLINMKDFSLSAYDKIRIEMPPMADVSEPDIDAELFAYVANASKDSGIHALADLDDAWVQATFPTMSGIGELRNTIRASLIRDSSVAFQTLKFAKCSDVLLERLEGEVPAEAIDAQVPEVRQRSEQIIASYGVSTARYFEEEHLTAESYEAKLREEAAHDVSLNIALDKMIEATATTVPNDELTDYLSCENPALFLTELRESGKVEEARKAATRVKVMRRIVDTAEIDTIE